MSQSQHRYQISKGKDGEVKVEVIDAGQSKDDNIVIDNKDYNYTLIISGQNIQVIHHDTNRNLTYKHGLRVSGNTCHIIQSLLSLIGGGCEWSRCVWRVDRNNNNFPTT